MRSNTKVSFHQPNWSEGSVRLFSLFVVLAILFFVAPSAFASSPDDSLGPGSRKRILSTSMSSRARASKKVTRERGSSEEKADAAEAKDRDLSQSIGRTNRGRLRGSISLPQAGPGFVLRSRHAFGTLDTIRYIEFASGKVSMEYEGTVPIVVGAISRRQGGRLRRHKSHQSGRDADIGYFKTGNKALRLFHPMSRRSLDAEKSWAYIEALLETGAVQYIFADYRLQKYLRKAAENMGWPAAELDQIFQYPNGRRSRVGIIRHSSGHHDHFHVRFTCPNGHARCAD